MSEDGGGSYDVALSFAGEDRGYVERVASHLRDSGVRVFYDRYEEATLWGKDLYEHLDDVYQNEAKYVLMFASKHYARKVWPTHERRSAQARALREKGEYSDAKPRLRGGMISARSRCGLRRSFALKRASGK